MPDSPYALPATMSRRRALLLGIGAALLPGRAAAALAPGDPGPARTGVHPEPRPGITAAAVLDPATVPEEARTAYQAAREIPGILDGLFCHCDCADRDDLRSLLSCFEGRMPLHCRICLGEARLALRLARQGRTLEQIRAAVDRRYG